MQLTDWIPCKTPPVRDGWYDLERRLNDGSVIQAAERVRFANGEWDRHSSKSEIGVWVGMDYWRGVTRESLECSGNKACAAEHCMWPQCKPNELLQTLRGVTKESK